MSVFGNITKSVKLTRAAESESRPESDWSESAVLAGVGDGAGVGKIWTTPTPAPSRRLTQATEYNFGQTIMHPPETNKKQEEKESGSV